MPERNETLNPVFSWPMDEDGKPLDMVTYQCSELIGLPNYSNVTVGPASITRFMKNEPNDRKKLCDDVEIILREQREIILNTVKKQSK